MKLEVTVTYGDDRKEKFLCNDFPTYGDFITLYREGFERTSLRLSTIHRVETRFVNR